MKNTSSARVRSYFLASTALLALPAIAHAQEGTRPAGSTEEAHNGPSITTTVELPQTGLVTINPVETPEVTINNNFTTNDARDPVNVNGIGQMFINNGNGTVGLCTATLINPRTVIFAAHCVNSRAATAYGANSGGTPIAFGFETNTRANAAGQPDELINWFNGGSTGPGVNRTNTAQSFYNALQVFYNPASQAAASCTAPTSCFLEADIATAVLDTPAANIPTWTMLFSPLPTPSSINPATGTGYHVTITGYGSFGNGTTGSATGSDFRRRVAENMLGALTSINARNTFLFGTAGSPSRPQLLYWMDFDDPRRGTAGADPEDFNGFRDNALPREGLTGPGDSGSPLILDQTYSTRTIIGVLSGGSTFFGGQPGGSYGTQSFYQPLFLYWDWIVANNPYRYVTAVSGNRNWEDGASWLTTLDPAYQILSGGNLVNGLPTEAGGTNVVTTPQFGEVCFQSPLNGTPVLSNECINLATGAARNNVPNTPTGTSDEAPVATATVTDAAEPATVALGDGQSGNWLDGSIETPSAAPGYVDGPLPAPTLANGLPGATNFVPNNSDGVRATGVAARYYDVNLRNTGTVTLNSAVTIDNLSISGAGAGLNIANGASLTSLMRVNQLTGNMNVNGTLTSTGDYFFMTGLLSGTGRINAPFLSSVMGSIAPGTIGSIGTLTVSGNTVMSSGSQLLVDLGPGNTSDRLAVITGAPGSGTANIGGTVAFSPVTGHTIKAGDLYTILTAQGGVTGTFSTSALSAILTPKFVYSANQVQAQIIPSLYQNVLYPSATPVQNAYAYLLDRNRGGGAPNLPAVYSWLDLQNLATIRSTLEGWAPRAETTKGAIGTTAVENLNRFYNSRLASMDFDSGFGGSVAVIGNPIQTVARASSGPQNSNVNISGLLNDSYGETEMSAKLPENMRAYLAGGYLDGWNSSMPTAIPFGNRDNYDGYFIAGGIETELTDNAGLGFSLSYTDIEGTTGGVAQTARGRMIQGTIYGKFSLTGGMTIDTQLGAAYLRAETARTATLGPTTYNLQSRDDVLALSGEIGVSKMFPVGMLEVGPRVAMRFSRIDFTPLVETGGGPALAYDRGSYDSVQGLAGLTLSGGVKIRPYASTYFVHETEDNPAYFGANFVGGVGLLAPFALANADTDWFEASAGIAFGTEKLEIAIGADTTIGRDNISNQSYRGSITFKF